MARPLETFLSESVNESVRRTYNVTLSLKTLLQYLPDCLEQPREVRKREIPATY
jgi:hypothetical protein